MNIVKIADLRLPAWQRLADIAISLFLICVLLPMMVLVALGILMVMGRPVLFRQKRPGVAGNIFEIVKFRTMRIEESNTGKEGSPDAARITRLGAFLRKTSLDELPELWNILLGEMSFVGPRPLLVEYLPYYTHEELRRFWVRPGLTGLAQISGRNFLDWDSRLRIDARYPEELSIKLYFSVMFLTVRKVLTGTDVAVDAYSVAKPLHVERAKQPRRHIYE